MADEHQRSEDPRHSARILALQSLFFQTYKELESKVHLIEISVEEAALADDIDNYDEKLFERLVTGVQGNFEEINDIITKYAPQWPITQIQKVDLEILRIAIYEGFLGKITPPKVAIDEAIELAKDFGGSKSDKFVNGVLGAIYEKRDAPSQ